jgi:hypothetical protein
MVCATRVKRGSTLATIKSANLGQAKFRRRVVLRVHGCSLNFRNGNVDAVGVRDEASITLRGAV